MMRYEPMGGALTASRNENEKEGVEALRQLRLLLRVA